MTEEDVPTQRVQKILTQFEAFFDSQTVVQMPDEAFAQLVGVFPQTVRQVRQSSEDLNESRV